MYSKPPHSHRKRKKHGTKSSLKSVVITKSHIPTVQSELEKSFGMSNVVSTLEREKEIESTHREKFPFWFITALFFLFFRFYIFYFSFLLFIWHSYLGCHSERASSAIWNQKSAISEDDTFPASMLERGPRKCHSQPCEMTCSLFLNFLLSPPWRSWTKYFRFLCSRQKIELYILT